MSQIFDLEFASQLTYVGKIFLKSSLSTLAAKEIEKRWKKKAKLILLILLIYKQNNCTSKC